MEKGSIDNNLEKRFYQNFSFLFLLVILQSSTYLLSHHTSAASIFFYPTEQMTAYKMQNKVIGSHVYSSNFIIVTNSLPKTDYSSCAAIETHFCAVPTFK